MKLIIIAGFLGSGKTTFLLELARAFSQRGTHRLAIIENEVGSVGVDDRVLTEHGLTVREIYSGCVCCSLRMDLIQTLLDLERTIAPDIVIIEPSGVASPRQVLQALQGYGGQIEEKVVYTLVDASRFQAVTDLSIPLIQDGIQAADQILLNKVDLVSPAELTALRERIRELRSDVPIVPVSAVRSETLTALLNLILASAPVADETVHGENAQPSGYAVPAAAGPTPAVHAREFRLHFEVPQASEIWRARLPALVAEVARELQQAGCQLLGHIKAVMKTDGGGYYLVRTTDFIRPPDVKGRLAANLSSAHLVLNAIVYGMDNAGLAEVVDAVADRYV